MAFTSHGHHIPGTTMDNKPKDRHRCGGPQLCSQCRREVMIHISKERFDKETVEHDIKASNNEASALQIRLEYFINDLKSHGDAYIARGLVVERLERILKN